MEKSSQSPNLRSSKSSYIVPSLIKSDGNELFPSIFGNGDELPDRLVVHAHGIIDGEFISRHALVDVARPVHTRNIRDARERRAVSSERRSAMKWDRASTAAFEVVPSINTFVRLHCEFRVPENPAGGITLIAQNVPLPLVGVTFGWGLAGAVVGGSALPVAFLVGGFANTLATVGSVTVRALEVTRIVLGASGNRMVGVVAVASCFLHLAGEEVYDLRLANDQRSRDKNRVGLDESRDS